MKYLIIVESPVKARKIESYLQNYKGNNYIVKSSFGHIRDLDKKNMGIDVNNNYKPKYKISNMKIVRELKNQFKKVDKVIIASDKDREGEAIGWHLCKVLGLNVKTTDRIIFNEITKKAIKEAVDHPQKINMDLVNAQQGRRLLDRLVGFTISPLLWCNIGSNLSAGRVQSIALKLIVDKEENINNFKTESYYYTSGLFNKILTTELNKRLEANCIELFLNNCKEAEFKLNDIKESTHMKHPPPPFTTSTLQQNGCSKLGMSASSIMKMAQKLYEMGLITYHRTDSTNLSSYITNKIEEFVKEKYGDKYHQFRKYKNKVKNVQEAHEAIRPTKISLENPNIQGPMKRLYVLIWKRTVASQMSSAIYYSQGYKIMISNRDEKFKGKQDLLKFDGYLKLYGTKVDNIETMKLNIKNGEKVFYTNVKCDEKYKQPPERYSESKIIKKLKSIGVGRPSTYASIINTILNKKYVVIKNVEGEKKKVLNYLLSNDNIIKKDGIFIYQSEKKKMIPLEVGKSICKFMNKNFENIMDYKFTSLMEDNLDDISKGKISWVEVIDKYYKSIQENVKNVKKFEREQLLENSENNYEVVQGRYGPILVVGSQRVNLPKNIKVESITPDKVFELLSYPKNLGKYEGKDIFLHIGTNGKYIKYMKDVINVEKLEEVNYETVISKIKDKNKNLIKTFGKDIRVMNGKYGPFIIYKKKLYKIPKGKDATKLDKKEIMVIVNNKSKYKSKSKYKFSKK